METFTVTITLIVKADTAEEARRIAEERCKPHAWIAEKPWEPPFPNGALLWFQVKASDR